jgi:hypothetical protein
LVVPFLYREFRPKTLEQGGGMLGTKRKCCGLMLSGDRKRTRIRSAVKPGLESPRGKFQGRVEEVDTDREIKSARLT